MEELKFCVWAGAAAGAGVVLGPNRARMELLDILPSAAALAELSWAGLVSATPGVEVGTEAGLGLVDTKSPNSEFRPAEIRVQESDFLEFNGTEP